MSLAQERSDQQNQEKDKMHQRCNASVEMHHSMGTADACRTIAADDAVADPEGVPWVPWNPLCVNSLCVFMSTQTRLLLFIDTSGTPLQNFLDPPL